MNPLRSNSRSTQRPKGNGGLLPGLIGLTVAGLLAGFAGCRKAEVADAPSNVGSSVTLPEQFVRVPPAFSDDGPTLSHSLTVRNDTERAVRFVDVQHTCACTSAHLDAKNLDPGQETLLWINARLAGRSGEQRFVCTLIDDSGAAWIYGIETTIYQARRFAETGVYFGLVDPNGVESRRTEFVLSGRDERAISHQVTVKSDSETVRVVVGEAVREVLPDGIHQARIPIDMRLSVPTATGVSQTTIRAKFAGDAKHEWPQQVCWNVRSLFTVEPRQVFFGAVKPGAEPLTRRVMLRRTDGQPLKVKALRGAGKAIEAEMELPAKDDSVQLKVTLNPARLTRALWEEIEVETDHPLQPVIKIPVACVLKEPVTVPNLTP